MAGKTLTLALVVTWAATLYGTASPSPGKPGSLDPETLRTPDRGLLSELFQTSDTCIVCHDNLVTPSGENVSIGSDWRSSMMANSARDPYWQAAVRREILDHPGAREDIEDECSICHMPMATYEARAAGRKGEIFARLPIGAGDSREDAIAGDGVSCALCHQITPDRLGTPESFTGGYVVDEARPHGQRPVFGSYAVDAGRAGVMRSASGFVPTEATHLQSSDVCATCHTLITTALDASSRPIGQLPEQTPYQEWRASAFRTRQACQACHMPVVAEPTPITGVLGQPREGMSRHVFRGGNFFMMQMLNRYRAELGVVATPGEMDAGIRRTVTHLETETARVRLEDPTIASGRLNATVTIQNLAGHKFPTAYPSRRAWLEFTVQDASGRVVFSSGAFEPNGSIAGNDFDRDPARFEPHYSEIRRSDEVQVYESVMAGPDGRLTTGLLTGVKYVKDNRLLPEGLDKRAAPADIAVHGAAADDEDFVAGGDRVRYSVDLAGAQGPFDVTVRLWFQPIAFRWAENLRSYDAPETRRFVRYYDSMAAVSAIPIARATTSVRRPGL
jgi:hypothetical protein